jgi:hypothetical protein
MTNELIERYGVNWKAPNGVTHEPMPDGYWTPWHIADAENERLQAKLDRAVSVLKELRADGLSDRYVSDDARNKRVHAVIAENEGAKP